jgi:hypothetical protein
MKNQNVRRLKWWVAVGSAGALIALLASPRVGNATDLPRLEIKWLSNNVFQVAVTNGVAGTNYALQWRETLGPQDSWHWLAGQTNLIFDGGIVKLSGFFQAVNCTDCDNDWVQDNMDGNPNDPNILELAVTIDDPADGSSVP